MDTFGIFKIMKTQVYPNTEVVLQDKMEIKKKKADMFTWKNYVCGWIFFSGNLGKKIMNFHVNHHFYFAFTISGGFVRFFTIAF